MSHEIDFSKGYAAMFAVRVPVWHQAETGAKRLAYHPTVAEALIEAGLDFVVSKVPTKRQLPDGSLADNALAFSTIRLDTGAELGMVGRDYTPLQNAEALSIFEPLLQSGYALIETAGALRGGADVWVAVAWNLDRMEKVAELFAGVEPRGLLPYSVIRNNHNGRSNVVGYDTTICPVCANTLGYGLSQSGASETEEREGIISATAFAVRHSQNVKANVEGQARALWENRVAMFELVAKQYQLLRATALSDLAFSRLVLDVAVPDPRLRASWNPAARMAGAVLDRFEAKRTEIKRLWHDGAGHQGDSSAWEAYNGLAEALDHNNDLWPLRSGIFRTQALLDGQLGATKQAVANRLAAYAQGDAGMRQRLLATRSSTLFLGPAYQDDALNGTE